MTDWKFEHLLNARQVAYLLGRDPKSFPHAPFEQEPLLPIPVNGDREQPLWTPDQIRQVMVVAPQGGSKTRDRVELKDSELLTVKQIAALHNPPHTSQTTFASYVRRTRRLIDEGKADKSIALAPLPSKRVMGHPLWHPFDIKVYLANRPGPGYWVSKEQGRDSYTGGRVPKGRRKEADTGGVLLAEREDA